MCSPNYELVVVFSWCFPAVTEGGQLESSCENESAFSARQIPRYLKMLNRQWCAVCRFIIGKMLANQIFGHLIALVVAVVGSDIQWIMF